MGMYYIVGRIDETQVRRYTPEQAMIKMLVTGHWGPWDDGDDDE